MKTSLTKLKSSLILSLGVLSLPLLAKPIAQVTEVTGQVFIVSPDGKTNTLKVNDHLEDRSEVMVEEGATISLNDYYDSTYHMIGGTHVKFFDKSVQLKRGKTWIQSRTTKQPLVVTTANGHIEFMKSEFIATFEQTTSRTQALVVSGEVEVSNVLNQNLKYSVAAGSFSLIDPEVDDGIPRTPVKVGINSLNSALAEFKKLPEKLKETTPSRSIASVEEKPVKKGEIIFMTSGRMPASVGGEAHHYFKKKAVAKKMPAPAVTKNTTAEIRYYGIPSYAPAVLKLVEAPRAPASIAPTTGYKLPKKLTNNIISDDEFGSSLKKHLEDQPKYPKELDTLIQDLKSY